MNKKFLILGLFFLLLLTGCQEQTNTYNAKENDGKSNSEIAEKEKKTDEISLSEYHMEIEKNFKIFEEKEKEFFIIYNKAKRDSSINYKNNIIEVYNDELKKIEALKPPNGYDNLHFEYISIRREMKNSLEKLLENKEEKYVIEYLKNHNKIEEWNINYSKKNEVF